VKAEDAARIFAEFRPGLEVYLQGAVGEPLALREALMAEPEALTGVSLTGCFIPGINDFDYAALNPMARLTSFMLPPAFRQSFETGRVVVRPMAYSQIVEALRSGPAPDLAILQVTPPDGEGECSFGPCADFAPLVARRAGRRLALVNPLLPRPRRGPTIPFAALEVAIEVEAPFITAAEPTPTPAQSEIARRVAAMVPDGAAIQTGIGGVPAAALGELAKRRGLRVHTGMVTEGYRLLDEAGALAPHEEIVTGFAYGGAAFVNWACDRCLFADANETHGPARLGRVDRLFAINSALEVDLFGQANIEWRAGQLVSGLGGAPDFSRAARRSRGGRAILALPATAGRVSRIVPRLTSPTVSLPGADADLVITERGIADIRGLALDDRAEALIEIAAPEHRAELTRAWAEIRGGL
jgi:acyl-CoA hydrolase